MMKFWCSNFHSCSSTRSLSSGGQYPWHLSLSHHALWLFGMGAMLRRRPEDLSLLDLPGQPPSWLVHPWEGRPVFIASWAWFPVHHLIGTSRRQNDKRNWKHYLPAILRTQARAGNYDSGSYCFGRHSDTGRVPFSSQQGNLTYRFTMAFHDQASAFPMNCLILLSISILILAIKRTLQILEQISTIGRWEFLCMKQDNRVFHKHTNIVRLGLLLTLYSHVFGVFLFFFLKLMLVNVIMETMGCMRMTYYGDQFTELVDF